MTNSSHVDAIFSDIVVATSKVDYCRYFLQIMELASLIQVIESGLFLYLHKLMPVIMPFTLGNILGDQKEVQLCREQLINSI